MELNKQEQSASENSSRVRWRCPVCKTMLISYDNTWLCENKHSFDQAKEGYINLLLPQHKSSKEPGDNKEMVLARQAFLATQAYAPLAKILGELCETYFQAVYHMQTVNVRYLENPLVLFDVGCSEGYYSAAIMRYMSDINIDLQVGGLDISKPAIQKAAKQHRQHQFAVASSYNIPLPDNCVDIALQVFAPSCHAEVRRILKPNGIWLVVEPSANHLRELKAFVYDQVKTHTTNDELPSGFTLLKKMKVSFTFSLEQKCDRLNLLKMTPYYWRISADNKERLLENLHTVTADFTVKQFGNEVAVL